MNYFGHAHVACWERDDAAFVLGAMLPDFSSMCRARLRDVEHPEMAQGVAYHHRTDRAFHETHSFRSLCAWSGETLRGMGMRRAPSLAVAHVGVELLLDGTLLGDDPARAAYLRALAVADGLDHAIAWSSTDGARRFRRLQDRLVKHGVPDDCRDPDAVAERLRWALHMRPRLALTAPEESITRVWARQAQPRVKREGPALFDELRLAMATAA